MWELPNQASRLEIQNPTIKLSKCMTQQMFTILGYLIRLELTQSVPTSVYATSLQMFLPASSSSLLYKRANQIAAPPSATKERKRTKPRMALQCNGGDGKRRCERRRPLRTLAEKILNHTPTPGFLRLGRLVQLRSHKTVENGHCDHHIVTKDKIL